MRKSSIFHYVLFGGILLTTLFASLTPTGTTQAQSQNPQPPAEPVKLIFIHHSCGENWLMDGNGDLGRTLGENNYFVSDTNYGWGPDSIGDATDYYNWYDWFLGPESSHYLDALYTERDQNSDYFRPISDPGGENQIIMFKSCFPNSDLAGNPGDPPGDVEWNTVSHAKYIYNQLLSYFSTRPDKLFIAITPPPLLDPTHADNAREFSRWLVEDWLTESNYPLNNVATWDFHNVLTHPDNHHRYLAGSIQHITQNGNGTLHYDSAGDEHPNDLGNQKSTAEFIPMLNTFYNHWAANLPPSTYPKAVEPTHQEDNQGTSEGESGSTPVPLGYVKTNVIDDFEGGPPKGTNGWEAFWDHDSNSDLTCRLDQDKAHTGVSSLQIKFQVEPNGWATCPLFYDSPRDFSDNQGLSFDYQASAQGLIFAVDAYGGTPDVRSTYFYSIVTNAESVSGWTHVELTWEQIVRADWEENPGTPINPAEISGFAFGFSADFDSSHAGTIWIDNINLIAGDRMPSEKGGQDEVPLQTSSDEERGLTLEETGETGAEQELETAAGRNRFCPGSITMIPLIIFAVVYSLKQQSDKDREC